MDKKSIKIITGKFRCFDCKEWKSGTEFRRNSGTKRPVESYCKVCRKIREARDRPTCKECKKVKKINNNNLCFGCNKKFGLKQCNQCKELLIILTDYPTDSHGQFSKKCKYCTGLWEKDPEIIISEDYLILTQKE